MQDYNLQLKQIKEEIEFLITNFIDENGYDDKLIDALANLHMELDGLFGN